LPEQKKLQFFLENWISEKINLILKSLIDLKNSKESKSNIRALSYQLYENNGVVKRENVIDYLNKLNQEERKILRNIGIKFGRYHIYSYKLLKPEAVSLRLILWKNYHQKYFDFKPPKFGLNFLESKKSLNKNFMLICGFEKFDDFFVRIDILERLFLQIINSDKEKTKEIMLVPEMLNLLGCNKDNFIKLIKKMNYKSIEKENKVYFKYLPFKNKNYKNDNKTINENSPFNVLKELSIK
jgi:ATP-dependent RNA helicase SUPV3L1/SUV3